MDLATVGLSRRLNAAHTLTTPGAAGARRWAHIVVLAGVTGAPRGRPLRRLRGAPRSRGYGGRPSGLCEQRLRELRTDARQPPPHGLPRCRPRRPGPRLRRAHKNGKQIYEAALTLPVELDAMAILRGKGFRVVVSRTANTAVIKLTPAEVNGRLLTTLGVHNDVAAREHLRERRPQTC